MSKKLNQLLQTMKEEKIDLLFLDNPHTISLLTGYFSEPHERLLTLILAPKNSASFLFTPALEERDAKTSVKDLQVYSYRDSENPWSKIKQIIFDFEIPFIKWGVEKNYLTLERKEALEEIFPKSFIEKDFTPAIENLKLIKSSEELELMKTAGYWADEAIKIGASVLREGISELEVVAEIEYHLKKRGITQMSFETIVLFGANAASPHGVPGTKSLEKNQFVLFDLGVMYQGYVSDVSRTLFFGDTPSSEQTRIYHLVLEAHDTAMQQAAIGLPAAELDRVARDIITDAGYGEYFTHRLGHGLGQNVHEYPSIMAGNSLPLANHMCFSIEPGIYLPEVIGVRIEDCGYLDSSGFHPFTTFPTSLDSYANFLETL